MVRDIYGGHLLLFFCCLGYSRPHSRHSRAYYNPLANLHPLHTDHSNSLPPPLQYTNNLTYLQSTWRALSSSLAGFPFPLKFLRIQHHRDHLAAPMDTNKSKSASKAARGIFSKHKYLRIHVRLRFFLWLPVCFPFTVWFCAWRPGL